MACHDSFLILNSAHSAHDLFTDLHGQTPGGWRAPSNGEVPEGSGDAIHRGPPDHEVKTGNASELCLQDAPSRSVSW